MTDTVQPLQIPLDAIANYVDTYRFLDRKIHELVEQRDAVKVQIKNALGDNEIGTVGGLKAVSYKRITQHRLSISLVRKKFTEDQLADCFIDSHPDRFTVY